jgi:hypothetical protein
MHFPLYHGAFDEVDSATRENKTCFIQNKNRTQSWGGGCEAT